MKPQELRLGNLVRYTGSVLSVTQIGKEAVILEDSQEFLAITDLKYIEPIELTEEWADRLGFIGYTKDYIRASKKNRFVKLEFVNHKFHVLHFDMFDSRWEFEHIKYVHQLQNFFYWNTGEELTIKEKETV